MVHLMAEGDHNPSYEGSWTDESGDSWRRKGKRGRVLETRRIRSLLRRDDVPLVVWQSFDTTLYDEVPAKLAAADQLGDLAAENGDVLASEWSAEDGRLLLMLEHFC